MATESLISLQCKTRCKSARTRQHDMLHMNAKKQRHRQLVIFCANFLLFVPLQKDGDKTQYYAIMAGSN